MERLRSTNNVYGISKGFMEYQEAFMEYKNLVWNARMIKWNTRSPMEYQVAFIEAQVG